MSHTEGPGDNVDHEAHMRDVMADVRVMRRELDEALAILRRFVNFAKEMPSDLMACLQMGNRIVADAEAFLAKGSSANPSTKD